ncbi:MAG: 4-phospho-D-threonate 3-dehydrogenase, partial [Clostridiales bacterium]|nr:4-phospho-D-threonate 3-dehydrogenase [Clostridiales bacterium]
MAKPRVVIPIGDPAGIGPEIALKAVCDSTVRQAADCVLVGSRDVLKDAARFSDCPADFRLIHSPADYEDNGCVHLVSLDNVEMNRLKMGQISAMCGRAAYEYIEKSVAFAMNGEADAVCTTAINKESLKAGQV